MTGYLLDTNVISELTRDVPETQDSQKTFQATANSLHVTKMKESWDWYSERRSRS